MKYVALIAAVVIIIDTSCRPQQTVVYPEYSEVKNTIDSLPHLNDSTLMINGASKDPLYGRVSEKPIFVGVTNAWKGGENREKFFNALTGPQGQELTAYRLKSCCPFKTLNSRTAGPDQKFGLLDIWLVNYEGSETDTLYVNPYDEGPLIAPKGYKIRK